MPFTPQTFQQLVQLLTNQYAAAAGLPANTNVGSTLGSIFNSIALLALNVQNELTQVENVSRMLTSTGLDLDTWGAQFGIPRIGATPSTGSVTFSTQSAVVSPLVIPLGAVVATAGGLQYIIIAPLNSSDPNFTNYNAALGGYVIPVNASSISGTVQCLSNGTIGNVAANTITQPSSTGTSPLINGIATLTNAAAFVDGSGSEADTNYQTRMTTTLSTGTVATPNAVAGAILSVLPGLTYSLGDGLNTVGGPAVGTFTAVVNIAGQPFAPPASLLATVANAVQKVRAAGIFATVIAPAIQQVDVIGTISVTATSTVSVAQALANIKVLVQQYLNGIGLNPSGGSTIAEISQLYVIMRTYPNVTNVTGVAQKLSTSGTFAQSDIVVGFAQQLVSSGSVSLTPGL